MSFDQTLSTEQMLEALSTDMRGISLNQPRSDRIYSINGKNMSQGMLYQMMKQNCEQRSFAPSQSQNRFPNEAWQMDTSQ